jgi:hypothetical protein
MGEFSSPFFVFLLGLSERSVMASLGLMVLLVLAFFGSCAFPVL